MFEGIDIVLIKSCLPSIIGILVDINRKKYFLVLENYSLNDQCNILEVAVGRFMCSAYQSSKTQSDILDKVAKIAPNIYEKGFVCNHIRVTSIENFVIDLEGELLHELNQNWIKDWRSNDANQQYSQQIKEDLGKILSIFEEFEKTKTIMASSNIIRILVRTGTLDKDSSENSTQTQYKVLLDNFSSVKFVSPEEWRNESDITYGLRNFMKELCS